jgi:hypothetical protein
VNAARRQTLSPLRRSNATSKEPSSSARVVQARLMRINAPALQRCLIASLPADSDDLCFETVPFMVSEILRQTSTASET